MTRYFQLPEGGIIREEWLPNMGFSASYPEVQVVPLDAIVIRREEFAARPVLHHEGQIKSGGAVIPSHSLPEYAEDTARHYLALAQWLRENPPVDEAQVKALLSVIDDKAPGESYRDWSRRLVERGVRVEVPAKQPQPEKSEDIKAWLKERGAAS